MYDGVMIQCRPSVEFHICSAQKANPANWAAVIYVILSQYGYRRAGIHNCESIYELNVSSEQYCELNMNKKYRT